MSVSGRCERAACRAHRGGHERLARPDPPQPDRGRRAAAADRRGLAARRHVEPGDLREGDPRLRRLRRRAARAGRARAAARGDLRARSRSRTCSWPPTCCARSTTRPTATTASSRSRSTPDVAHDTDATLEQARDYWKRVDRPNVMIKIPGTDGGPAGDRAGDLRGHQHQRHAAVLGRGLREGGRGLHPRARAAARGGRVASTSTRSRASSSRASTPRSTSGSRSAGNTDLQGSAGRRATRARRTCASRRSSTASGSPSCATPARRCSARCGRRPASRTRSTRTRSTSTSSSRRDTVNTMPMPTLLAAGEQAEITRRDRRRRRGRGRGRRCSGWRRRHRHGATSPRSCSRRRRRCSSRRWTKLIAGVESAREAVVTGRPATIESDIPDELEPAIAERVKQRGRARTSRAASGARTRRSGARPARPRSANRLGWLTIAESMLEQARRPDGVRRRGAARRPHRLRAARHGRLVARARGDPRSRSARSSAASGCTCSTRPTPARCATLESTRRPVEDALPGLVEVGRDDRDAVALPLLLRARRAGTGDQFVAITDPGSPLAEARRGARLPARLPERPRHRRPLLGAVVLRASCPRR